MSERETIDAKIVGGRYDGRTGRWYVEVRLFGTPKCVQIGAPASVTLRTTEMPKEQP